MRIFLEIFTRVLSPRPVRNFVLSSFCFLGHPKYQFDTSYSLDCNEHFLPFSRPRPRNRFFFKTITNPLKSHMKWSRLGVIRLVSFCSFISLHITMEYFKVSNLCRTVMRRLYINKISEFPNLKSRIFYLPNLNHETFITRDLRRF